MNTKLVEQFINYISIERGFSPRTIRAYEYDLSAFLNFMNGKNVKSITKDEIRSFISHLAQKGIKKPNSEITRARKLSAIKSFFKYLVRENIIHINPAIDIESPKIPEKEPSYLTEGEYHKLLHTVKRVATPYYQFRDLAIITTFLGTGIRLSELVGLTTNSMSLTERIIKVRGKGNKERIIPLNDAVVLALDKYLKSRPEVDTNRLFVSRRGNGLCSGSVYHLVKRYLKETEIKKEKIGVHSLRHTFGASLLSNGANLVVIQELLGHKKLETTRRYLHINNIDLRNAVDRLVFNKK